MNGMLALLFRFVVIVLGYAVAALCASAFLHLVTLPLLGFTAEETSFIVMGSIGFSIPFIALFVAYFAFIPAMFGILLGEVLGQRDWLFYALAGGVIGAVVAGFFRGDVEAVNPIATETAFVVALVGAGICGGIGYWLIAGRGAGNWRQPRRDLTSPEP